MMFATLDKVKDETTGKMRERTKVSRAAAPPHGLHPPQLALHGGYSSPVLGSGLI